MDENYICDDCGEEFMSEETIPYCPQCGSDNIVKSL